jgi:heme exporter protein A
MMTMAYLSARNLDCRRGRRRLFSDLSIDLKAGQMLFVSGRNGSGKSTLLRTLCGLTRPESGAVSWRGNPIDRQRDAFHAELVYVGHAPALKDDLSALENLVASLEVAGTAASAPSPREVLVALGLESCADLPAKVLSQGQRRRVALARLWLSRKASLWVLDEPFVALDAEATESLRRLLAAHVEAGGILVLTTHQEIDVAPERTQRLRLDS